MRTTRAATSALVLGRPERRACEPSYFFATSVRYQRRIVSGVTTPTISASRRQPRALPFTARRRGWSSVRRIRWVPCAARRDPILLEQVVNDCLLLPVDPAGEKEDKKRERRRQQVHGASVPERSVRIKARQIRDPAPSHFALTSEPQAYCVCIDTRILERSAAGGVFAQDEVRSRDAYSLLSSSKKGDVQVV